jgi:hypothetical protein
LVAGLIDNLEAHVINLAYIRHHEANRRGLDRARDYVWSQLVEAGCDVVDHIWQLNKIRFHNIVGEKPAGFYNPTTVLVMAHYDTTSESPGADDNASGVAVMLESAKAISVMDLPARVIFAALAFEENPQTSGGPYGSKAFVQYIRNRGIPIQAAVCLEAVGVAGPQFKQSTPSGLNITLPERGDFLGVIGNEASKSLIDRYMRVTSAVAPSLNALSLVVPGNGEALPDVRRSAHAAFWDWGYKAIMLSDTAEFRYPHHHKVTDTPEKLNYAFMGDLVRSIVAFAQDLAVNPEA